jgi:hypothetical protein
MPNRKGFCSSKKFFIDFLQDRCYLRKAQWSLVQATARPLSAQATPRVFTDTPQYIIIETQNLFLFSVDGQNLRRVSIAKSERQLVVLPRNTVQSYLPFNGSGTAFFQRNIIKFTGRTRRDP